VPHPAEPVSETLERERRLRTLFDNLPALSAYWDRDLRNVIANRAYIQWFGRSPAQMLGMHIRDVLGPALYAKNLPYIEGALAGREQRFDRTIVDTTGAARHTQASYVPDLVDGTVAGFFVLVTDVTPRVEAEQALAEAQRLAEVGSWQMDTTSAAVTWSAEMYRIVGVDPATFQIDVDRYLSMVHPDDRDHLAGAFQTAIDTGVGYEVDYRLIRPDSQVRHIHARGQPETDEHGKVVRLRGTVQDVSAARRTAAELHRINQELSDANRIQADVIGMLGHDVRQPLTNLLAYLSELTDDWETIDEQTKRADLRRATAAAERLGTLVDDILTMARLDAGAIACRPCPIPLAAAVRFAAHSIADDIDIDIDPGQTVDVDPFHLQQILTNLISNATKYGRPPWGVTSTVGENGIAVSIHDQGDGVPEEFIPHLFERFARATTGIATTKPGTGLGLYLVHRLAEANGGTLSYRNHQPYGACFTLTLRSSGTGEEGGDTSLPSGSGTSRLPLPERRVSARRVVNPQGVTK
jgi:PAS domain S-box-containing protein